MGDVSRPIMTPLGVLYRGYCYNQDEALKCAEWAVKLFGGSTAAFHQLGPNGKGFYEAVVLATVPAGARCIKKPADAPPEDWQSIPEAACVLFDDTTAPVALYFKARGLLLKPKESPPLTAYCAVPAE